MVAYYPWKPRGGQSGRVKRRRIRKVFKNGRESPWGATLIEPVPRLIRILVSDSAQKIIGGQQFYHAAFVIFLYEGAKLQTRLFAAVVPVWLVQESFRNWTKTTILSNITLVRTDLGH